MSKYIFTLSMIVTLLLSGCAPAGQMAIGAGETFNGMRAALNQAPGTFMMSCNQLVLFAWPRGANYAFAIVGEGNLPTFNSLRMQTLSMAELVKTLEGSGWGYITPAQVPGYIGGALGTMTMEAATAALGRLPMIFMLPLAIDPAMPAPVEVKG